jgi:hypothetical protein
MELSLLVWSVFRRRSDTFGQPGAKLVMTGDIQELVGGFWAAPARAPVITGDINYGGAHGQVAFSDFNFFVALLSPQPIPTACPQAAAAIGPRRGNDCSAAR